MSLFSISTHTLMIAISSTVMERCRLLDRIACVDSVVEQDEHLTEQVMDIDKALDELAGLYEEQIKIDRMYSAYETLVADTKRFYANLTGSECNL